MKTEPIHSEMSAPAASRRAASSIYQYQPRRGLSIPCISVLDHEGRIIEEQQRSVFRFCVQQGYGADIIFGVGTNGEWNRISNCERQRLIQIEADEVRRQP